MKFFLLDTPAYRTDQAMSRTNPIEPRSPVQIPGIICSVCHATWGGFNETFIPLPEGFHDSRLQNAPPIKDKDWSALVNELRVALNLPNEFELRPGDSLGIPEYFVKPNKSDFLFYLGPLLVSSRVAEVLKSSEITGVELTKIRTTWHPRVEDKSSSPPDLYGLKIDGRGWRGGVDLNSIMVCNQCGRRIFPKSDRIVVDERRWDGMDVSILDMNPSFVVVTERVKDILDQYQFTNYQLIPVASTGL